MQDNLFHDIIATIFDLISLIGFSLSADFITFPVVTGFMVKLFLRSMFYHTLKFIKNRCDIYERKKADI